MYLTWPWLWLWRVGSRLPFRETHDRPCEATNWTFMIPIPISTSSSPFVAFVSRNGFCSPLTTFQLFCQLVNLSFHIICSMPWSGTISWHLNSSSASSKIIIFPSAHDRAYFDAYILHCNTKTAKIVTNAMARGLPVDWELSIETFRPTVRTSFPFLALDLVVFFYGRKHGSLCPLLCSAICGFKWAKMTENQLDTGRFALL